jgi:hypothetical protein
MSRPDDAPRSIEERGGATSAARAAGHLRVSVPSRAKTDLLARFRRSRHP